ncbi:MAG: hypothetical protein WCP52_09115, partial [Bacteroidota bacterium]
MKKLKLITMMLFALLWGLSGKGQSGASCVSSISFDERLDTVVPPNTQTQLTQWYKVRAQETTMDVFVNGTKYLASDIAYKIIGYSGTCSSLTQIETDTLVGSTDSVLQLHLTGLTIGNTYYFKVSKHDSTHTISYEIKAMFALGVNPTCDYTGPLYDCDLVQNGGFEKYAPLPPSTTVDLGNKVFWACPWNCDITLSSPDLFSDQVPGCLSCTITAEYQLSPVNLYGTNSAASTYSVAGGTNHTYAGFYTGRNSPFFQDEHIQEQLRMPMLAGVTYNVSMQVKCADFSGKATDHIGMYISTNPITMADLPPNITTTNTYAYYPNTYVGTLIGAHGINFLHAQINSATMSSSPGFIKSDDGWVTISGQYTALGGEDYIMIGYFGETLVYDATTYPTFSSYSPPHPEFTTNATIVDQSLYFPSPTYPLSFPNNLFAYYYLDNVSITAVVPTLSFTGPLTNCLKDN